MAHQRKILEFYSGIGGMHCSWNDSLISGVIVAAVDINTVANQVYKYNFPDTYLVTRNIQSMSPTEIKKLKADTILMSPPCQPFTRNGKCLDENDARTDSFLYLINILNQLHDVQYILMENVKGFECSNVRKIFIEKLVECGFVYQEFLLSPSSVGIPNSRLRYYCLARRENTDWNFQYNSEIMKGLPNDYKEPETLSNYIEENVPETFIIPDKMLKHGNILDVCYKGSNRSCCFTKAYSHYIEGTGSVFTEASPEFAAQVFSDANKYERGTEQYITTLRKLKLRFFTPKEVLSLMAFPNNYKFPDHISRKQCYRLLGNSINVKVVSELLKILFQ